MTDAEKDAQMMRQIADGLAMVVSAIRARYPQVEAAATVEEPRPMPFLRRTVDPDVAELESMIASKTGG